MAAAAPEITGPTRNHHDVVEACLAKATAYNDRELEFLRSVRLQGALSEAQWAWLDELAKRDPIDFDKINGSARLVLLALLKRWLPDGKEHGKEFVALNPTRSDTKAGSFRINTTNGAWADFATPHRGGDPISLAAYLHHGGDQIAAARALREMLGA